MSTGGSLDSGSTLAGSRTGYELAGSCLESDPAQDSCVSFVAHWSRSTAVVSTPDVNRRRHLTLTAPRFGRSVEYRFRAVAPFQHSQPTAMSWPATIPVALLTRFQRRRWKLMKRAVLPILASLARQHQPELTEQRVRLPARVTARRTAYASCRPTGRQHNGGN